MKPCALPTRVPDTDSNRYHYVARGAVERVALPPSAGRLSTLSRLDYTDAFVGGTTLASERTGEQWARAALEGAPATTRAALKQGWLALGLRLGSSHDERLVLGWQVRQSAPDFAVIGADSPLGLRGEVLFQRRPRRLLLATFVQLNNPIAQLVWAGVVPVHQSAVRHVLQQAIRGVDRPGVST